MQSGALPKKSRWVRNIVVGTLLLCVIAGVGALLLRSQWGIRTVVIPYVSKRLGGELKIASPKLSWDGVLTGDNAQIKVTDSSGAVWLTAAMPTVTMKLLGEEPALTAHRCDLDVLRLPQRDEDERRRALIKSRIPKVSIQIDQLNVLFTEMPGLGGVPSLALKTVSLEGDGIQLVASAKGITDFGECHSSLHWLNRTNVVFSVVATQSKAGLRWIGEFAASNSFETAPLPELESASVQCKFDVTEMGSGTLSIALRGQEFELLTLDAEVDPGTVSRRVTVDVGGPALKLPSGLEGTSLDIEPWKSRCRLNWNLDDVTFDGVGSFDFPGVTVGLPNDGGSLPPLKLSGTLGVSRALSGAYAWNGKVDLKKGITSLLNLKASSKGDVPVYLNLPHRRLAELRPYFKPLGMTLPDGRIGGRLSLSVNEKGGYDGQAALHISELVVDKESGDAVNVDLSVGGRLAPGDSLELKHVLLKGNLEGGKKAGKRGDFELRMTHASAIYFDSRNRQDFPGKVTFGLTMRVSDPKRVPGGSINIRGRTGIHLLESPRCWFELLGDYRGRSFLQVAADVLMNKDWSLRHMEVSNFTVHNYTKNHAALLGNVFDGQLKGFSAMGVVKQREQNQTALYDFSGNVRCTGLQMDYVPNGPGLSKDIQLSGSLDLGVRQLEVSRLLVSGRIPSSDKHPSEVRYALTSKGKMALRWSPRLYFRTGQLEFSGALPSSYLPNYTLGQKPVPLRIRALLSAESSEGARHATALSVSSTFGGKAVGELDMTGSFTGAGKIRSLRLTRSALSIPKELAALLGGWCPEIDNATCAGVYADGAFKFLGGAPSIGRLAALPKEAAAACSYRLVGTHTDGVTRITDSKFSLVCDAPDKPACLRIGVRFEKPGIVNWKPHRVADFSLPLKLSVDACPLVIRRIRPLEQVHEELAATCSTIVSFDGTKIVADADAVIAVGQETVGRFRGTVTTSRYFKPKAVQIKNLQVWNRHGVDLTMILGDSQSWDELQMAGLCDLVKRTHQGFFKLKSFTAPRCGMLPWDLSVVGGGSYRTNGKLRFNQVELTGTSKSKSGKVSRFSAKTKGELKLDVTRTPSISLETFLGATSMDGTFPASWISETCGELPTDSDETVSIKALADMSSELVSLKLNGTVGGVQAVSIGGNLGLAAGIPIMGSIECRASGHPTIFPLTRRFGIHDFESATATFAAAPIKETPGFKGVWAAKSIRLFAMKDTIAQLTLNGNLEGRFSKGGRPASVDSFIQTLTFGDETKASKLRLLAPVEIMAGKSATLGVDLDVPEAFLMGWMNRPGTTDNARYVATGTVSVTGGDGWTSDLTGTVRRNEATVAELNGQASFTRDGRFNEASIKRFDLTHANGVERLVPTLGRLQWKTLSIDGRIAAKGTGYESSCNAFLADWRPSWAHPTCSIDSRAKIRATANARLVCAIRQLDVTSKVIDLARKKAVGELTTSIVGNGVFTPLGDRPAGQGKIKLAGRFDALPGVGGVMKPCTLDGFVEVVAGKTRFSTAAHLAIKDSAGTVASVKGVLTSGWDFGLQSMKVQQLRLAQRPWVAAVLPTAPIEWTSMTCEGGMAKTTPNTPLSGDWLLELGGATLDWWSNTDCQVKTTMTMAGDTPSFAKTTIVVNGKGRTTKKPHYRCVFRQSDGKLTVNTATLSDTNLGNWAFEGDLEPVFIKAVCGRKTLKAGLPFRGKIAYDGVQGKGSVILFHDKEEVLSLEPEFNRKERFLGVKLQVRTISDALAAAVADPSVMPTFKRAEATVTVRGNAKNAWAVYAKVAADEVRDRNGWFEKGDFAFNAQFNLAPTASGWTTTTPFPLSTTWNEKTIADGDVSVSLREAGRGNVSLKNLKFPLTTIFDMLNRQTLSPRVVCTGGNVLGNLSCGITDDGWVANSIFKIDNAKFLETIGGERTPFDFSWDLVLNGSRDDSGTRKLSVKANGPGWKNEADLRLGWSPGERLPSYIRLKGNDLDVSSIHRILRRTPKFTIPTDGRVDLGALLPTAAEIRKHRAHYAVELSDLTIGPLKFSDVDISYQAKNGRCDLLSCSVTLAGSKIDGAGFLDVTGSTANMMVTAKGASPLKPVFAFMYGGEDPDAIKGIVDFDFQAKGTGTSIADLAKQVTGSGSFVVKDFSFYELPGLEQAAKEMMIEDFNRFKFDTIESKLALEEGTLKSKDLTFSRDEMTMTMTALWRMDGRSEMRDIDWNFSMAHKTKVLGSRLSASIGRGWESLSSDRDGYRTFRLPFVFILDASGWTAKAADDAVVEPFNDSTVGKWISSVFKRDTKRSTSP